MGLQLGSGGGSQSGYSSGTSSGTTTGDQSGTQSGSTTATPTSGWGDMDTMLRTLIGNGGNTGTQTGALGNMQSIINDAAGVVPGIDAANAALGNYGTAHQAYSTAPTSTVGTGQVSAPTAASLMGQYQDPYTQQVVDATTADANNSLLTGLNALKSSYGGQLGNGREGVAAGQAVGDYTRGLASTIGSLRNQGFNTALAGGQGDAANALTASGQNAANTLTASGQNAANTLNTNEFNVGQQNLNDQQAMNALQDFQGNLINRNALQVGDATSLYNMGQGGVNNMLSYLQSQIPAFGQSSTQSTSNKASGSSTGEQSGYNAGSSNQSSTGAKI